MMEDNKFCLQMKSHPKQLFGAFRELYESCSLTDVTFMCEGQSFSAHRLILSACSPYFRDLFMNLSDKHPVVFLKGVKKEEITNLLNFMYDGEVTISHTNLASFLEMADELSINGLSKTDSATGIVPNKAPSVDVEEEVTYHKPKRQRVSSETLVSNECKPFPSVAVSSHVSSVSSHSTNEMTDYSNPFPSLSEDHTSGANDSLVRNRTSAVFQQSSISTHCQSLQNDNHVDMSKKSAFSIENVNIKEEIQVLDDSMSPGKDDDLSIPFSVPSDNLYTGGNLQEGSLDKGCGDKACKRQRQLSRDEVSRSVQEIAPLSFPPIICKAEKRVTPVEENNIILKKPEEIERQKMPIRVVDTNSLLDNSRFNQFVAGTLSVDGRGGNGGVHQIDGSTSTITKPVSIMKSKKKQCTYSSNFHFQSNVVKEVQAPLSRNNKARKSIAVRCIREMRHGLLTKTADSCMSISSTEVGKIRKQRACSTDQDDDGRAGNAKPENINTLNPVETIENTGSGNVHHSMSSSLRVQTKGKVMRLIRDATTGRVIIKEI